MFWLARSYILEEYVARSEQQVIEEQVARTKGILKALDEGLIRHAKDWSHWDKAYEFVENDDKDFLKNYANIHVINSRIFRAIGVVDQEGRYLGGSSARPGGIRSESQLDTWQSFSISAARYAAIRKLEIYSTYALIDGRISLIAVSRINKIGQSNAPKGYLVVAREIGANDFEPGLQRNVLITPATDSRFPSFSKDPRYITINVPLADVNGNVNSVITINEERLFVAAAYHLEFLLAVVSAIGIIAAYIAVFLLLHRNVTQRLRNLIGHLSFVSTTGQLVPVPYSERDDEIGSLTAEFNTMIKSVAASRKAEEQAREDVFKAASEAEQMKFNALAAVNHELRTPLASLICVIEMLPDCDSNEKRDQMLSVLTSTSEMLRRVVDDALEVAKLENNDLKLEKIEFDILQLAQESIESHQKEAKAKGLDLRLFSELPARSAWVRGDKLRLRQVISNLIVNAIKFTDVGQISLHIRKDLQKLGAPIWRIEVRDTGIGIPHELQARLFDAYVQADTNLARRHLGAGLGLNICHRIINAMGGEIGVVSHENHGATFWFDVQLPDVGDPRPLAARATLGSPRVGLQILLVEDDPMLRMIIHETLAELGHSVTAVADGLAAVGMVTEATFDLIIMDLQMPVMSGAEACQRIRAIDDVGTSVAILALTGNVNSLKDKKGNALPFDGVLVKPFNRLELQESIDGVFEKVAID